MTQLIEEFLGPGTRPSLITMSRGTVNSDRAWQWYDNRAPRKHMTADLMREQLRVAVKLCCTSVDACWQEVRRMQWVVAGAIPPVY